MILFCAVGIVVPVCGFGGEGPGWFVAGSDVDAAKEDGDEA